MAIYLQLTLGYCRHRESSWTSLSSLLALCRVPEDQNCIVISKIPSHIEIKITGTVSESDTKSSVPNTLETRLLLIMMLSMSYLSPWPKK